MTDEAETRSARAPDDRRHPGGGPGEQSPLQVRASFLKNWDWQFVIGLNRGACARGSAQHGLNRETSCGTAIAALRSFSLTATPSLMSGGSSARRFSPTCLQLVGAK